MYMRLCTISYIHKKRRVDRSILSCNLVEIHSAATRSWFRGLGLRVGSGFGVIFRVPGKASYCWNRWSHRYMRTIDERIFKEIRNFEIS